MPVLTSSRSRARSRSATKADVLVSWWLSSGFWCRWWRASIVSGRTAAITFCIGSDMDIPPSILTYPISPDRAALAARTRPGEERAPHLNHPPLGALDGAMPAGEHRLPCAGWEARMKGGVDTPLGLNFGTIAPDSC